MLSTENLPDSGNLKALNILLVAMDNLDYETLIKKLKDNAKNTPLTKDADPCDIHSEDDFNQTKEKLMASIALVGLQEVFGMLGELFTTISKPEQATDIMESIKTYATVESPKPADMEPNDDERVKLTGQPEIDSEIIFNIIKQQTK